MPAFRFDTHVHSTHSPDGHDGLEAFARLIDAGQLDGIGFAEHYDFLPICGAWEYLDEAAYTAEVASWVGRGYRFYAGVEVDHVSSELPEIRRRLAAFRFDFVIGSVHTLPSGCVSDRDIDHFRDDAVFGRILDEYAAEFLVCLKVDEYDVMAHPGVFLRYLDEAFFAGKSWRKRIRELEAGLAEAAAASGKIIEVNSSGLFAPVASTCATPFFLEHYRDHGGRRISLASDAHRAVHVRRGFGQAAAMLAGLGLDEVWLPWDPSAPIAMADYLGEGGGS
jgi:histidinol-phosphatase (PHP family)